MKEHTKSARAATAASKRKTTSQTLARMGTSKRKTHWQAPARNLRFWEYALGGTCGHMSSGTTAWLHQVAECYYEAGSSALTCDSSRSREQQRSTRTPQGMQAYMLCCPIPRARANAPLKNGDPTTSPNTKASIDHTRVAATTRESALIACHSGRTTHAQESFRRAAILLPLRS